MTDTTIPDEAVEAGVRDWLLRSGYDPDDEPTDDGFGLSSGDIGAMREDMRGFLAAARPALTRAAVAAERRNMAACIDALSIIDRNSIAKHPRDVRDAAARIARAGGDPTGKADHE